MADKPTVGSPHPKGPMDLARPRRRRKATPEPDEAKLTRRELLVTPLTDHHAGPTYRDLPDVAAWIDRTFPETP